MLSRQKVNGYAHRRGLATFHYNRGQRSRPAQLKSTALGFSNLRDAKIVESKSGRLECRGYSSQHLAANVVSARACLFKRQLLKNGEQSGTNFRIEKRIVVGSCGCVHAQNVRSFNVHSKVGVH